MFFRQILHRDLGCASYVIADGGEAAVVDPKSEIEEYLRLAEEEGFEIAYILETHNHADHLSGRGRLAEATGATIHVPNADEVAFAAKAVSATATRSSSAKRGSSRWAPRATGPSTSPTSSTTPAAARRPGSC